MPLIIEKMMINGIMPKNVTPWPWRCRRYKNWCSNLF